MFLHLKIVAVGKIKNQEIASLIAEYQKRLSPFCKLETIELPSVSFLHKSAENKSKQHEGEKILAYLKKNSTENFFLLEENGKEFSSINFSQKLGSFSGCITFLIAGTLGFSDEIKQLSLPRLSLSQMTFPHEMARLLLLEQLYRAISIINGKKYHY
jgi:23S rRNA (pseudouridine1915-N3)-methyltransferase